MSQVTSDTASTKKNRATPLPYRRYFAVVGAAIVLTIVAGVVQGRLSGRWSESSVLEEAGIRLRQFPKEFGDWRMSKEKELSEKVEGTLMCSGYLHRIYENQKSGESVNVAVLVGPPGPMSVHTPEICFSSRQFDIEGKRREVTLSDQENREVSFWEIGFQSRDVRARGLQVYYAWNNGNGWQASSNPRFGFATAPYLYKIQMAVAANVGPSSEASLSQAKAPGIKFLNDFLPTLRPFLVSEQEGHVSETREPVAGS